MQLELKALVFFICLAYCHAEEQSAYDENLLEVSTECTRRCSLDDPTLLKCWGQSLQYYTERLAQAASGYTGTLLWLQRWRQRNEGGDGFEQNALAEFMKSFNASFHDEEADGLRVTPETMEQVFNLLLNTSSVMYNEKYTDEAELLPNFACPTPCDYDYKMWRTLFFVMVGVFVLSLLSFAAYLYSQRQYMNEWKREKLVKA